MLRLKEVAVDLDFFGKGNFTEIEAVIRVLKCVRFIYRDDNLTEAYSESLYKLLRVPRNFELLRKKLCEEEEEVEEGDGLIEEIEDVSCSDVEAAI